MGDRVTLSELSRRTGHNKGYIHKLKIRGVLVFGADGLIDTDDAATAVAEARDPARQAVMREVNAKQREKFGKPTPPGFVATPVATAAAAATVPSGEPDGAADLARMAPGSQPELPLSANATFMQAKTRREQIGAEQAELEYRRRAGELVERKKVDAAVFEAFRALRDRVMTVGPTCASVVVGLADVREIELTITEEVRRAFAGFETHTVEAIRSRISA